MLHVADTHALFWYLTASPRLSSKIEEIFDFAEKGQGIIVIPSIVLAELLRILEKKKKGKEFLEILRSIEKNTNYLIYPLDARTLRKLPLFSESYDLHDRIIMSCGRILRASILTKDSKMKKAKGVRAVW